MAKEALSGPGERRPHRHDDGHSTAGRQRCSGRWQLVAAADTAATHLSQNAQWTVAANRSPTLASGSGSVPLRVPRSQFGGVNLVARLARMEALRLVPRARLKVLRGALA